jgi:hypothetical protein
MGQMIERGREWGGPQWHAGGWKGTSVDLAAIREMAGRVQAWTQRWWRWCGIEAGAEEECARGVDPRVVREAAVWTQLWWRGRGEGARVVAK